MKKIALVILLAISAYSLNQAFCSSYPFKITLTSKKVKQGHTFACFITSSKKIKCAYMIFEGRKYILHRIHKNKILRTFVGVDVAHPAGIKNISYTVVTSDNKAFSLKGKIEVVPHIFRQKTYDGRIFRPTVKLNRQMIEILKDRKTLLKERKIVVAILKSVSPRQLWRGSFLFPTKWLTYRIKTVRGKKVRTPREKPIFGAMRVSILKNGKKRVRYHRGTDYVNFAWTKVYASQSGKVVLSRNLRASGNTVIIDHGQGIFTFYCHLIKTYPKEGTFVKKGSVIARIGSTGLSTGAHLHFEVRVNSVSVTPTQWYNYAFKLPLYY